MARTSTAAMTDEEVLRRVQVLGDAIAEEQRQNKVAIALRQPLRDWHIHVQLLEEVARLLVNDITGRPAFVGWMSLYMRNCLLCSMQSRRAPIALAAVGVVKALLQHGASRAAVAIVCSWFLPCLLRLAASSSVASVVSAAAMCTLLSVAQKCMLTLESVNSLLSDCGASSAAVRRCAVVVLRSYLEAATGTSVQLSVKAYTEALHRVISERMHDADAEVRYSARRCFWALHILEPASTAALFRALPAGLQRRLANERRDAIQEHKAVESSPVSPVPSPSAPTRGCPAHQAPRVSDRAHASRTVTLKDALQSAAASRARALAVRVTSPRKAHRQLLRSAIEAAVAQEWDGALPAPHLRTREADTGTASSAPALPYAASPHSGNGMSFLTSMESTDWSVRRAAVLQGQKLCENDSLTNENAARLLAGLLARVQDIHFRVVEGAQNCLRTLMTRVPTATSQEFHSLLPSLVGALLRNMSHARPVVCAGARRLLSCIVCTHVPPQELLKAVLRAADDVGGAVAVAQRCAELLHYVMLVHPSLFADVSAMGIALRGILAHLRALECRSHKATHSTGVRVAQRSWLTALGAALLACPESFRQVAEQLASSEQEEVRVALRESFGLTDKEWRGQLSSAFAVDNRPLRCLFAEELKTSTMPERLGTGTGESIASADGRMVKDGVVSGMKPLSNRALQNASQQLYEFLSVGESCLASSWAARALAEDAVTRAAPGPIPVLPPQLAQPSTADRCDGSSVVHAAALWCASPTAERSGDPVADFLRQRPKCRDFEERLRALLALAAALRASGTAAAEKSTNVYRLNCAPEGVERLLVHWERELCGLEEEMHHRVRWAMLAALDALLQWPAARSAVARQLARVLSVCRSGLDDPFVEVQVQAAACIDTFMSTSQLPADLILGAITGCLMRWSQGPMSDAATPGWLTLMQMISRIVEEAQPTLAGGKDAHALGPGVLPGRSGYQRAHILTAPVLHRVVAALNRCLGHCHVSVRLCAVLVLAAIRRALGDAVTLPFLAPLSAAHLRLVDVYLGKVVEGCA
ncbi:hypothetical protein JIQ42_02250 [Leishmania sp. Namibia]|uniref:hypothetical protein n=1 Tax=Leishmania sp. Namibia TaxID=2802991 RepID=UPI001B641389|nr:hypothetical protein JIQ42_02250 [Leishmania sp. Namibia]